MAKRIHGSPTTGRAKSAYHLTLKIKNRLLKSPWQQAYGYHVEKKD